MASASVPVANWAQQMAARRWKPPVTSSTPGPSSQVSTPATYDSSAFGALASLGAGMGGPQLAQILKEFTSNYNTYGDKMRGANQDQIRAGLQARGLTETPSGMDIESRAATDFNNQLAQGYVQQVMPFAQQMADSMGRLKAQRQAMELELERAQKMIPIDSQAFKQGARDYKSEYPGAGGTSTSSLQNESRLQDYQDKIANAYDGMSGTGEIQGGPAEGTGVQTYEDWKSQGGFSKGKKPVDYSFSRQLAAEYTANREAKAQKENERTSYGAQPSSPPSQSRSSSPRVGAPIQQVGPGSYSNVPSNYYPSTPTKPTVQKPTVAPPASKASNFWSDNN